MKRLAIHLGLGDAICFAGLALKIAKGDDLIFPCWRHNEVSVKSFFINHPNIHVEIVDNDHDLYNYEIKLGQYNIGIPPLEGEDFIQWFYRQAGGDVTKRGEYCPIKEASKNFVYDGMYPNTNLFSFVHDDKKRGFNIRPKYRGQNWFSPGIDEKGILQYADVLKRAKEIHCIDSSFLHLADTLETTGKLYWHRYARNDNPRFGDYHKIKEWEVVE